MKLTNILLVLNLSCTLIGMYFLVDWVMFLHSNFSNQLSHLLESLLTQGVFIYEECKK